MKHVLVTLLLITVGTVPCAAQPDLSLDDVRRAYQQMNGLEAHFTQVVGSEFSADSSRISGTVVLSGNRYRVETPVETVVANDSTTWIYTPADSQVVVNDAATDDGPITPETFLASSGEQYEEVDRASVTRNGTPHVRLRLTATGNDARFKEAHLWVRTSDRVVTRLRATDWGESTYDLRLREITVNPSLDRTPFTFTAPDGVEVVDLRSS